MKKLFYFITFQVMLLMAFSAVAQNDVKIRKEFDSGLILISVNPALNNGNEFDKSSMPYQEDVVGISTGNKNPIKISDLVLKDGIAYVKVCTENGSIKKGDLITSSSEQGVGMKATESGIVLGIALEDAQTASGLVKVRLMIQYVKQ